MNDQKPMDKGRGRYLIAAAVIVLVVVVGAVYFLIVGIRGDDENTGPNSPTTEVVVPSLSLLAGAAR
jgi:hypothetical protein